MVRESSFRRAVQTTDKAGGTKMALPKKAVIKNPRAVNIDERRNDWTTIPSCLRYEPFRPCRLLQTQMNV